MKSFRVLLTLQILLNFFFEIITFVRIFQYNLLGSYETKEVAGFFVFSQ